LIPFWNFRKGNSFKKQVTERLYGECRSGGYDYGPGPRGGVSQDGSFR
jgi:hypothetical protein